MKTMKYLFAGALMLGFSAQAMAQDVQAQIDAITKVVVSANGNAATVKDQVKEYVKVNKKNAEALAGLGTAFLKAKNTGEATKYADMAIKANKSEAAGYLLKGDIAATNDDGGEAAMWYQTATIQDPKDPSGYIRYARIYQKVDALGAANMLEKLRTVDPSYPVDADIAYMYSRNGKMKMAVDYYDKVKDWSKIDTYYLSDYAVSAMLLGQQEKSLAAAKKGLSMKPRNAGFNRMAFYNSTDLKQYDEALNYADALFNRSDSLKTLPNDFKYLAYAQKGAGRTQEAIENFKKVYDMDNTQTDLLKTIAESYLETKSYDEAIEYYNKYNENSDQKRVADFEAIAHVYMEQAEIDEAIKKDFLMKADEVYAKIAVDFPNNEDYATYRRAALHHQMNPNLKEGAAKPFYEKYAQLLEQRTERSAAEDASLAVAYNYLAVYYIQNDKVAQAKEYAKKLAELQPDNETAKQILAI